MNIRRSRRWVRLALLALTASAAPMALLPSRAQELAGFRLLGPVAQGPLAPAEVSRGRAPEFDAGVTPLERHPVRLGAFETANVLPEGAVYLNIGTVQTSPGNGPATGNQMYFGGGAYALTDRLSVALEFQTYEDPVVDPINGLFPEIGLDTLALSGKYRLWSMGNLTVAGQASVEFYRFSSPLVGGPQDGQVAGSFKLPVTYAMSPQLQFHVTPAVSVLPDTIGGADTYGTIASLGAGVSFQPGRRLAFYGAVEMPFGPGGNTISNTATIENVLVWTVGGRWNVTPRVALDLFATNAIGTTPATSILTHFPDGDDPLLGVRLSYTPGGRFAESYRGRPAPVSDRQLGLQQDGFILDAAPVIEPGAVLAGGWYGTDDNRGLALAFSPDRDVELNVIAEQLANDGTAPAALIPSDGLRYLIGPKLRFMDQNNGDPFTLSARGLFGREIGSGTPGVGVFFASAAASYTFGDAVTVTVNPRLAAFGSTELYGLGIGANVRLFDGLDLVAEVMPVGGDSTDMTWAAGARYAIANSAFSVDLSASNAVGRYGIGAMVAQDSTRYSLGLTTRFSLR